MGDWIEEAEINADVVYFNLGNVDKYKNAAEIFIWDLDKTYLDTRFETLRDLVRTFFEKGFRKRNIPGVVPLLKGLELSWIDRFQKKGFPLYFITSSPPQMKKKILNKLNFDKIQPAGIFCKDNLQNLKPKRLWRLRKQVGYKIQALMQLRENLSEDVRFICWGDDSESDVIIYSLFSDICSRRSSVSEIKRILENLHVTGSQLKDILKYQEKIPVQDPIEKIYINLAEDTDAEYYLKFGRRCVPTYTSFQSALDLYQDKRLSVEQVLSVAKSLSEKYYFTQDELEKNLDDLIRRRILFKSTINNILPSLQEQNLIHKHFEPSITPISAEGFRYLEPLVYDHIDYLHDYR